MKYLLIILAALGLCATSQAQTLLISPFGGTCAVASTSVSGCVKVDGTSITISGGVISASASAPSFAAVTAGTNTSGLVIGTGGSLGVSGTGTIGATSVTGLSVTAGKTLTVSNSLTLAGTDSTVMTFPSVSATIPGVGIANTFTQPQSITGAGAASTAQLLINGTWFVAGSATTNYPAMYVKASGANDGNLSTSGNGLVVNGPSGFAGILIAAQSNGTAPVFTVSATGSVVASSTSISTFVSLNGAAATALRLGSAAQINYSSTTAFSGAADLTLCRQGAGVLEIGAGTGCAATGTIQLASLSIQGARKGTFVCTGGGTITIANAAEAATSDVLISMNTAGGTITTAPAMKTVTAATGFTVLCGATDTSTYNYTILN